MTPEADDKALPMRVALHAEDVVAAGRAANVLQVPSPIYTVEFTGAHHVLIGAGGGGRKFGMANVALLLRVHSLRNAPSTSSSARSGMETTSAASPSPSPSATATEPPVWSFAAAIDLGADIPWCTSAFLPFNGHTALAEGSTSGPSALSWSNKQRVVLEGLVGFIALSSITSFTLIGIYQGTEPTSNTATPLPSDAAAAAAVKPQIPKLYHNNGGEERQRRYLRQLARITVPHDEKDPDKKPIALTQSLLLIAHDSNGILAYTLADLVPDSFEDEDEEEYQLKYAAQVKCGALQRRVPRVVTVATPVAEWQLPARVNDLSMNRVCIVQAESANVTGPSADAADASTQPCKAHLQEHLIVAAVLQNKSVVLSTLRLRRKFTSKTRSSGKHRKHAGTALENAGPDLVKVVLTLTGAELPLPFKLLTSSLRLVRLFGWNNITVAQHAEMRRQLTWQSLQEQGAPTRGPLCSLMLVAFNVHASESFIIHGAVEVTPLPSTSQESHGGLGLKLNWTQPQPTPVLGDAITSLSMCTDKVPADYEARIKRSPVGAAVPTHFIVGTVEGWVASVRWDAAEGRWHSDHIRPSPLKSVSKRFPALHKEPVSCVAVSAENDVVTADIAQNLALTTLPYALCTAATSASLLKAGSASGSPHGTHNRGGVSGDSLCVVQSRLATSSALFPTSMPRTGLLGWGAEERFNLPMPVRTLIFFLVPLLLLLVALAIMMH